MNNNIIVICSMDSCDKIKFSLEQILSSKKPNLFIDYIILNNSNLSENDLQKCKNSDSILVENVVSNLVIKDLMEQIKFHTKIRSFTGNKNYYIVSDAVNYTKNEIRKGTSGREGSDEICHSEIDVEKVARTAYELAESTNGSILNIDSPETLVSSYIWRKIVNDVNEDYPTIPLTNLDISDFPILFNNNTTSNILLVDHLYLNIVSKILLSHNNIQTETCFMNDTTQSLFVFNKNYLELSIKNALKNAYNI